MCPAVRPSMSLRLSESRREEDTHRAHGQIRPKAAVRVCTEQLAGEGGERGEGQPDEDKIFL